MPKKTLSVRDNRTGKEYEIEVRDGTIRAMDLRQIKESDEDFGLMAYDPGFTNTACCRSDITFIDGARGVLRYRGYPIEELAGEVSFLEVAYLLQFGELPDAGQRAEWVAAIKPHAAVEESVGNLIESFPPRSLPMSVLMSGVAALSSHYPEAVNVRDEAVRLQQVQRLIGKIPALAARAYRQEAGLAAVEPDPERSYAGNFLSMTFAGDSSYQPDAAIERAMDTLFVLHADHEQNCSTNAMRSVGSSRPDPYMAASAAIGALAGPLHGGANAAVLRMLETIGSKDNVPAHVERAKKGEFRLMGFGHRVYKNYDPRATIIKQLADEVFEVTGSNPLLDLALELERIALEDEYFIKRKLYPNVDFYSGLIYQAIGFPTAMFPVLFAIGRTPGWLAQWQESLRDEDQKIARPRQIYTGPAKRRLPER